MKKIQKAHPLGELIDQVKASNGWSDLDVARRAQADGYNISKSNISAIRLQPPRTLVPGQVRALAAGLGISRSQVALTTLSSMGIHITQESNSIADAIRRDVSLSETEKKTMLLMLGSIYAAKKGGAS